MTSPKTFTKTLICLCLTSLLTLGNVFAALYPGDCSLIEGDEFSSKNGFTVIKNKRIDDATLKRSDIIDLDSLNIAFLNLKKNCCENQTFNESNQNNCSWDVAYFQENIPNSFYLFDHVFDVLIRRLDGETGTTYLYPGATADEKGVERRTRINSTAENLTGTAPLITSNKYNEFWNIDQNNITEGFAQDSSKSASEYERMMTTWDNLNILQKYNELTLRERYENTCNIAGYIYFLSNVNVDKNIQSVTETKSMFLDSDRCNNFIKNRIKTENTYVQNVSIQRSNDLLIDNVSQFINVYLTQRLMDLLETIQKTNATFARVNRAVPKLEPVCM